MADAIVDILAANGISPIPKWVDDFAPFRFPLPGSVSPPFQYAYGLSELKDSVASLNIPWHETKWQDFDFTFRYVGFDWCIPDKLVSLPEEKRIKYHSLIDSFLNSFGTRSQAPLKDALKINGTLSHITFVCPEGRSYLSALSLWISKFPSRLSRRYVPASVVSDLRWWRHHLSTGGWSRSLQPRPPLQDLGLWVDASTSWGIGLVKSPLWDAWRLLPRWRGPGRDIGWLEAVAIELAVVHLESSGVRDSHVLIRSDNQGVIGAWERGRGRNFEVNLSIRRAYLIAFSCGISLSFLYVSSSDNLADPVSRGILGPSSLKINDTSVVPLPLARFIEHV